MIRNLSGGWISNDEYTVTFDDSKLEQYDSSTYSVYGKYKTKQHKDTEFSGYIYFNRQGNTFTLKGIGENHCSASCSDSFNMNLSDTGTEINTNLQHEEHNTNNTNTNFGGKKNSSSTTRTDSSHYINNTSSYSGSNSSLSIIEKVVLQNEIEELEREERRLERKYKELEQQIKENERKLVYEKQKKTAKEMVEISKNYYHKLAGLDIYELLVIFNKAVCYVSSFQGFSFNSKLGFLGYIFEKYSKIVSKEILSNPDFLFSDFFKIEINEDVGTINVINLFLSYDIPTAERRQTVNLDRYQISYVYGDIGDFHVYSKKEYKNLRIDSKSKFNFHRSKEKAIILNTSLQNYFGYKEKCDYDIKICFDLLRDLFSGKEEEYGLHNINDFEKCLKKDLEILSNKYIENEKRKKRISKVSRIVKVSIIGLFIFSIFISIKLAFH